MKTTINSLSRQHLLLAVSLLCFFNGIALMAPGIAFFTGEATRIVPLVFSLTAFYFAFCFFNVGRKTVQSE